MTKYEEALKVIMKYNPSKEYVDACGVLKEAIEKEKYDELNYVIPMWVDKIEEEAPRNPVDRVKRLIKDNDELEKEVNELKIALNFALTDRADYFHQLSEALGKINTLVDGIKAMVGVTVFYDRGVVSVSGLGYGEDSDIRYDSIVKSFEIVEGKK